MICDGTIRREGYPLGFCLSLAAGLSHQRRVQGVSMVHEVVRYDEIEESLQLGVPVPFGGPGVSLGDQFQKVIDIFPADRPNILFSKELLEIAQQVLAAKEILDKYHSPL